VSYHLKEQKEEVGPRSSPAPGWKEITKGIDRKERASPAIYKQTPEKMGGKRKGMIGCGPRRHAATGERKSPTKRGFCAGIQPKRVYCFWKLIRRENINRNPD